MDRAGPEPHSQRDGPESCPVPDIPPAQAVIDNLPYLAMLLLGGGLFALAFRGTAGGLAAAAYVAYGLTGALWIMLFVCPYCQFYGTRLCPCGYGQIAARLSPRQAHDGFRAQFRKHIPLLVPLWFLPLIPAAVSLMRHYSSPTLALLLAFVVNSFVVLPVVSRHYGCVKCPQQESCPWMGGCKHA